MSQKNVVKRKLHDKTGETIAETLVALLISALALVMLAGAISSTAKVITTSDKKMGNYYAGDKVLAVRSGTAVDTTTGTMTVTLTGEEGATSETHNSVNYYANGVFVSKPVVSYKVTTTP